MSGRNLYENKKLKHFHSKYQVPRLKALFVAADDLFEVDWWLWFDSEAIP
jgi:hypothetical protein